MTGCSSRRQHTNDAGLGSDFRLAGGLPMSHWPGPEPSRLQRRRASTITASGPSPALGQASGCLAARRRAGPPARASSSSDSDISNVPCAYFAYWWHGLQHKLHIH